MNLTMYQHRLEPAQKSVGEEFLEHEGIKDFKVAHTNLHTRSNAYQRPKVVNQKNLLAFKPEGRPSFTGELDHLVMRIGAQKQVEGLHKRLTVFKPP